MVDKDKYALILLSIINKLKDENKLLSRAATESEKTILVEKTLETDFDIVLEDITELPAVLHTYVDAMSSIVGDKSENPTFNTIIDKLNSDIAIMQHLIDKGAQEDMDQMLEELNLDLETLQQIAGSEGDKDLKEVTEDIKQGIDTTSAMLGVIEEADKNLINLNDKLALNLNDFREQITILKDTINGFCYGLQEIQNKVGAATNEIPDIRDTIDRDIGRLRYLTGTSILDMQLPANIEIISTYIERINILTGKVAVNLETAIRNISETQGGEEIDRINDSLNNIIGSSIRPTDISETIILLENQINTINAYSGCSESTFVSANTFAKQQINEICDLLEITNGNLEQIKNALIQLKEAMGGELDPGYIINNLSTINTITGKSATNLNSAVADINTGLTEINQLADAPSEEITIPAIKNAIGTSMSTMRTNIENLNGKINEMTYGLVEIGDKLNAPDIEINTLTTTFTNEIVRLNSKVGGAVTGMDLPTSIDKIDTEINRINAITGFSDTSLNSAITRLENMMNHP